jgi:hypothetical protein
MTGFSVKYLVSGPNRKEFNMFRRITIILAAALGLATQVMAHEGHDEEGPLTEKRAAALAAKTLPSLVQANKVEAAWAGAQREGIAARSAAGKQIWVVAYKNPDGKIDDGKSLFLIFDSLGNFVEANHTGTLKTE